MRLLQPYYFGIYHWRSRFRRLLGALAALGIAAFVGRRGRSPFAWPLASLVAVGAAIRAGRTLETLFSPPPWALERYKYDALAETLALSDADRLLDVGCGTGRSLVGLAPHVPSSCSTIGLDPFDDRVILGNGPALARRNARIAGMAVEPVRGDAASLPIAAGSQDVVTACRVLHDLPGDAVDPALRECARVCRDDGVLGVLELPVTPDGVDRDPEAFWTERVEAAGFDLRYVERVPRPGGEPYLVVVADPSPE
jgi:SAM-dependent methyltransferase